MWPLLVPASIALFFAWCTAVRAIARATPLTPNVPDDLPIDWTDRRTDPTMPNYLLTLYDQDGDATALPFRASDDDVAVADALAFAKHRTERLADIRRMTVDTLPHGARLPLSGEIATSTPDRLYDSAGRGSNPDPDDDGPDPDEIGRLRARLESLEDQVSVLRNDLDEACSGTPPPATPHHGHGDCSGGLIPIGVAAAIERTRFNRVPDEPESIPFLSA